MVINIDTKLNEFRDEMKGIKNEIVNEFQVEIQGMKNEIVKEFQNEMQGVKNEVESSKCQILDEVDNKVDCNKEEIVNSIEEKLKKFDKFSDVFVKIIASQNKFSSSLKHLTRNLPKRDGMLDNQELSQSLAATKYMDRSEMVGHLNQLKDAVKDLPQKADVLMNKSDRSQCATGG